MTRRIAKRLFLTAAFVAAAVLAASTPARSETIVLDALPITISYEARHTRVARKVASVCEEHAPRLARELGLVDMTPIDIIVTDDLRPYRESLGSQLPRWGVAFAMLAEQEIVVDVNRAANAWNSLDEVVPHELSHLFVAQRAPAGRFPVWFLEGLAKWQAGEWSLIDSWQVMNAVWSNEAPTLGQMTTGYPPGEEAARTAYRISYLAFTERFDHRFEDLPPFIDAINAHGGFAPAFAAFFGETVEAYAFAFQEDLQRRYHSRLLIFQTGPLFSIAAVLFLLIGLRFHLRKRRRLREMEAQERGFRLDE